MPSVVIKPCRDRDEYVVWSTVTESPHGYGDRTEMAELLRGGIRRNDEQDRRNPEPALARADRYGSSAHPEWGEGHWGDDCWIYHQAGILRRSGLYRAAVLQCEGRERDILDLLEPFDDEDGPRILVHAKQETVNSGDEALVAESEIALADDALAAIKREVESWNGGAGVTDYASGGLIRPAGDPGDDRIPAFLSGGFGYLPGHTGGMVEVGDVDENGDPPEEYFGADVLRRINERLRRD